MGLETEDIVRSFPQSRRGYDKDAVDAHLRQIASEVHSLRQRAERAERALADARASGGAPAAPEPESARNKVVSIIQAVEESASEIEAQSREAAREIEDGARRKAKDIVERAEQDGREHLQSVQSTIEDLRGKVEHLGGTLDGLEDEVRSGLDRALTDLGAVSAAVGAVRVTTAGSEKQRASWTGYEDRHTPPRTSADATPPLAAEAEPLPAPGETSGSDDDVPAVDLASGKDIATERSAADLLAALESQDAPGPEPQAAASVEPEPDPEPEPQPEPAESEPAEPDPTDPPDAIGSPESPTGEMPLAGSVESAAEAPDAEVEEADEGDIEAARLVALNMALNGASRDETDAYLQENFGPGDRSALLDEVYARIGG
ncbi:MAG: DivIVA domain-containing protein [Solirubrobacterales bacterium]